MRTSLEKRLKGGFSICVSDMISRNLVPAARRLNAVLVRVRSVRDGALSSSWDMKGCSGWMFCFCVISGF